MQRGNLRGRVQLTDRLARAAAIFDGRNAKDPRRDRVAGAEVPRALAEADRLSAWIEALEPEASEALRLAARCQHLERWMLPRSDFPEGRSGYLRWRKNAADHHANEAAAVLREVGYDQATIEAVRRINLKQDLARDRDAQTMEDALCLAFMERELEELAEKHDEQKLSRILRKTWQKMSERGRSAAAPLLDGLAPKTRALVLQAIG
jgi:Domain of unknown function (DUF4202)